MSAWSKIQMGWATVIKLSPGMTYSIGPSCDDDTIFIITRNYPFREYILIENRQKKCIYDSQIGGTSSGGLAIWHIDDKADFAGSRGYLGQHGWPYNGLHYRVALLQADGLYHLEKDINRGDHNDLYRAGDTFGISIKHPNSDAYQNGHVYETGNCIENINDMSGGTISFKFKDCYQLEPTQAPVTLHPTKTSTLLNKPLIVKSGSVCVHAIKFRKFKQVKLINCADSINQRWYMDNLGLIHAFQSPDKCLGYLAKKSKLVLVPCDHVVVVALVYSAEASTLVMAGTNKIMTKVGSMNKYKIKFSDFVIRNKQEWDLIEYETIIEYEGVNCNNPSCRLCKGDCDTDSDCFGSLRCAHRTTTSGNENIPGCIWSTKNDNIRFRKDDYCFRPLLVSPHTINYVGECGSEAYKCNECEGNCRSDNDCELGLICAERNGYEAVSGCYGEGDARDMFAKNICYKPPTNIPTQSPSFVPSAVPSIIPTMQPSMKPSYFPSYLPTMLPSSSMNPSTSNKPTSTPSNFPSSTPSLSLLPSTNPTSHPSIEPSQSYTPTLHPSGFPSMKPSLSFSPTYYPSEPPSDEPSSRPTISNSPSDTPSFEPTINPTEKPSWYPTIKPSSLPSMKPTVFNPTSKPTSEIFSIKFVGDACWGQCGRCTGDCDSDSDCAGGLRCAQRHGQEDVPQCAWTDMTIYLKSEKRDFCFKPPVLFKSHKVRYVGECGEENYLCRRCEGDCDTDDDCKGNLKCYSRDGFEKVPGCLEAGGSLDMFGKDICYDPDSL